MWKVCGWRPKVGLDDAQERHIIDAEMTHWFLPGDTKTMARLTIEFPDEASQILARLAAEDQTSKREVLRRALALYNHLHEQGVRTGGVRKLSITDKDDHILKDILF